MFQSKKMIVRMVVSLAALSLSQHAIAGRKLKGFYDVPNVPGGSQGFAVRGERLDNQRETYSFEMPLDLFGNTKEILITFRGNSVESITGVESKDCQVAGRDVTCNVVFDASEIDVQAAEAFIESTAITPEELDRRMATLSSFSGEPIGILKYRRKGGRD